ncbi:biotin--[acetyl-CoA-carboxylase] ligase [Ornithinimicrobium panacihumi]|uniref:biotin--[acetyl-CoA-carboxylase] ligase n=1 Tax=Ornithinimicrobium panacihumi TaxID=2008449 RepID=UPI003F8B849C
MEMLRWAAQEHHETIGSTNVEALRDPRIGRVVVADHQSGGLGRLGRSWQSPPGTGLAISVVVPPVQADLMGWLPLVAGLAVARALEESRWPVTAGLKWPNDVLVPLRDGASGVAPSHEAIAQGTDEVTTRQQEPVLEAEGMRWGKIAGTLAQVAGSGAVVIGTGLNVDHTVGQLPVPTATSWRLARGGAPLPEGAREDFLTAYLEHLARAHDELAGAGDTQGRRSGDDQDGEDRVGRVSAAYLKKSLTIGARVAVLRPDGSRVEGTATGLDRSGALVLEGPSGRSAHHAGDVQHARAPDRPGTDNLA